MNRIREKLPFLHKLIPQMAILFIIGLMFTTLLTYMSQFYSADDSIKNELVKFADEVSDEVVMAVNEYPASSWLLRYWYDNYEKLDIEYDALYQEGTETERKSRELSEHQPDLQLLYADEKDIEKLPPEDQKLFAEISYSHLITRINQIKKSYKVDYLFCVVAENKYTHQFFLFSAADPGSIRGTEYEEVYPLGVSVDVSKDQAIAMRNAVYNYRNLADAGNYVDYYEFFDVVKGRPVLIGMTYSLPTLHKSIRSGTIKGVAISLMLQSVLLMICLMIIYNLMLKPLQTVQDSIQKYMQSKDRDEVISSLSDVKAHNEIGQLARDVSDLANEIEEYTNNLQTITAERERISTELSLAAKIQDTVLPRDFPAFPDRSDFDIYSSMDPAKEVGGDFYDFFLVDDDHLCALIADVSGKGIPAALFMMSSKIILKNKAMEGKSPAEILYAANNDIVADNHAEMFLSVWIGILELSTGKLVAANAGHEYPVIIHADTGAELYRDKHGFVIGGMENMRYKEYELTLKPGDRIFTYTDGVPEATDSSNEMFGTDRMLEAIRRAGKVTPAGVLESVHKAVDDFVKEAEQFDDLTMLCLEYIGKADEITIDAIAGNIPVVTEFIDSRLEAVGCSYKAQMQIDVAIDEIFENIASYAYGDSTGKATVRFGFDEKAQTAYVTFMDQGTPFDPLNVEKPDISLSAEERKLGGLGIHIVRKTMDEVEYRYENGCNIMTIIKHI